MSEGYVSLCFGRLATGTAFIDQRPLDGATLR